MSNLPDNKVKLKLEAAKTMIGLDQPESSSLLVDMARVIDRLLDKDYEKNQKLKLSQTENVTNRLTRSAKTARKI